MELKKKISKLKTDLACKDMDIDNLKREIDELKNN
jgi:predicted RNase H-like nuclease (RuvC/YqgF family)